METGNSAPAEDENDRQLSGTVLEVLYVKGNVAACVNGENQ